MSNEEMPSHKMIFDYMQLYEVCDTSIKVKESSSLDFVSSKLVGVDKIKYSGSLQTLYEDDFETFMYYNAVDSVLVQKIHEARNYISIIFAISSLARIKLVDVISQMNNALASLAITEQTFNCITPWVLSRSCVHNLNAHPSVVCVDAGGNLIVPSNIQYVDVNTVVVTFASAFVGYVYIR